MDGGKGTTPLLFPIYPSIGSPTEKIQIQWPSATIISWITYCVIVTRILTKCFSFFSIYDTSIHLAFLTKDIPKICVIYVIFFHTALIWSWLKQWHSSFWHCHLHINPWHCCLEIFTDREGVRGHQSAEINLPLPPPIFISEPHKYKHIHLYLLNRYGGWDAWLPSGGEGRKK